MNDVRLEILAAICKVLRKLVPPALRWCMNTNGVCSDTLCGFQILLFGINSNCCKMTSSSKDHVVLLLAIDPIRSEYRGGTLLLTFEDLESIPLFVLYSPSMITSTIAARNNPKALWQKNSIIQKQMLLPSSAMERAPHSNHWADSRTLLSFESSLFTEHPSLRISRNAQK